MLWVYLEPVCRYHLPGTDKMKHSDEENPYADVLTGVDLGSDFEFSVKKEFTTTDDMLRICITAIVLVTG